MPIADHQRITRHFFRRVNSPELFRLFFEQFGIWEAMGLDGNGQNDEIYEAWDAWDRNGHENGGRVREALCRINDIGREKGRFTLLGRARECGVEDYQDLTVQKLAMVLYLDHRGAFDDAYDFFILEKADNLYSLLGREPVPCAPAAAAVRSFKAQLRAALKQETDGPRLRVEVEDRHPDKWMAAIPHQTHVKPDHEFDTQDEIVTRDRHPVYEMILIYYPDTGLLKLKAGRGRTKIERVATAFAETILGRDADFFATCEIVDFRPLREPGFAFAREPGDHFEWARPVMVEYCERSDPGTDYRIHRRDLVASDPGVLALLEARGMSLHEIEIMSLGICFKFPGGKSDTRTVELGVPNRSTLDETERDRYLEGVLMRWRLVNREAKKRLSRTELSRKAIRRRLLR